MKRRESELKDDLTLGMTENELQELSDVYFDELQENKTWLKRRSPWIKTFDSGEPLSVKLYQLEANKKSFYKVISAAEQEANKVNFYTNDAVPPTVRIACMGFSP